MNHPFVILVTGSRLYDGSAEAVVGRRLIGRAIADAIREAGAHEVIIRHGGCRGADMIADEWAQAMQRAGHQVEIDAMPADWERCAPNCPPGHLRIREGRPYCPLAGFNRNLDMVGKQPRPDVCLAFPLGPSNGTRHCVAHARAAGIPTVVYEIEAAA